MLKVKNFVPKTDIQQLPVTTEAMIALIRDIYGEGPVPLHRPVFESNERQYLVDCIDSNFVSSVGARVSEFEERMSAFTGTRFAVATVTGTAALHTALLVAGVRPGDEVITQALTFVATCNALSYIGAHPVFVDVDLDTLGMSPKSLRKWLTEHSEMRDGNAWNRTTGARISACVPMHTYGLPCRIEEIASVCEEFRITLIEDAAESLGSYVGNRHTGSFGRLGIFSFNGNKIITTGGGGMIVTDDEKLAKRAKHLTTTAKVPHPYEFVHDEVGYNYRLPNLNAALGCAQIEMLPAMLEIKADIASRYRAFCAENGIRFADAPDGTRPNNWLNAIVLTSRKERDAVLEHTNAQGLMTRPVWKLMNSLDSFSTCQHDGLENSQWLEDRVINLPSSVPEKEFYRLKT